MSPKAELVKQISATGFTEAIDLMACLAVLREGKSLVLPRALEAANAALAATIVQKALLQRVLMTIERAFTPANRQSDRHVRVAFIHLSDQNVFDEVANAGSRKHLQQACDTWRKYDADPRHKRLKHYRDKVVAHTGEQKLPVPLVSELTSYAMGTADVLARLVRGTGVVELQLKVQTAAYDASAKALWSVWRATGEIQIGGLPGGRPPLAQIGEGYATQQHGEINTGGRGRVESGLAHETKTHFAFRVDTACTRPRGIEKCWHVGAPNGSRIDGTRHSNAKWSEVTCPFAAASESDAINHPTHGLPMKAKGGAEIAAASIDHLHRYIELLFEPAKRRGKEIS